MIILIIRYRYYPTAYELYRKNILDENQIIGVLGTKQKTDKIDSYESLLPKKGIKLETEVEISFS